MGILTDVFVSTAEDALVYEAHLRSGSPLPEGKYERGEHKGITGLELGTLWAILERADWDLERYMLETVATGEGGESWLELFPPDFVRALASMDARTIEDASVEWAGTEELAGWSPDDLVPLLEDLQRLSRSAQAKGHGLYLWGSL
jgi:hypothetical protein